AVQGVDGDLGAEHCLPRRHARVDGEVGAVALEARVLCVADREEEVAAAGRLSGEPDLAPLGDALRNAHIIGPRTATREDETHAQGAAMDDLVQRHLDFRLAVLGKSAGTRLESVEARGEAARPRAHSECAAAGTGPHAAHAAKECLEEVRESAAPLEAAGTAAAKVERCTAESRRRAEFLPLLPVGAELVVAAALVGI